jgi:hypothetical protein
MSRHCAAEMLLRIIRDDRNKVNLASAVALDPPHTTCGCARYVTLVDFAPTMSLALSAIDDNEMTWPSTLACSLREP